MIVGNKNKFAIESKISEAYNEKSILALGFFVIYLNGICYGVRKSDATMLSCSYNEVLKRIKYKGKHIAYLFSEASAQEISIAVQSAIYDSFDAGSLKKDFGMSDSQLISYLNEKNILWVPDGDAAFDDGTNILQFDSGDNVRIISFINHDNLYDTINTINEFYMESSEFYRVIEKWSLLFIEKLNKEKKIRKKIKIFSTNDK